jgi:hypothetical protein
MSAVHQTIEQKDDHEFEVYSMADEGMSDQFPESGSFGLEYGKIWVENEQGTFDNINLSLDPQYVATHIQGTEPETDVEEALQEQRNPDRWADRPAHDYESLQKSIEHYESDPDTDYSDEDIEEFNGGWMEHFDNYMFAVEEGFAVPSTIEDWERFHEGIEEGPDVVLNLNETYHNSKWAEKGEIAAFSVEEDGSVSMEYTPDGYDPSTDGIMNNPAA